MRYRKLDTNGDYVIGHGPNEFWVDVADGVAQSIDTRLGLWVGEWFLDLTAGTPWLGQILGSGTRGTRDLAIQSRILGSPGVTGITDYSSTESTTTRNLDVSGRVDTIYGPVTVTTVAGAGTTVGPIGSTAVVLP
jgi:hypothetical protein